MQRDANTHRLTDEITKFNLGDQTTDVPYRMKLHPSGKAIVVSMALGGIKVVRIEKKDDEALPKLSWPLPAVISAAEKCSFMGTIKSLAFSSDGTLLALGAEDGKVHIMSWPALEKKGVIDVTKNTAKGVRSVDFSSAHDDRILITVDEWGSCSLWCTDTLKVICELKKPHNMPKMTFFRCVSKMEQGGIAVYGAANFMRQGYLVRWKQAQSDWQGDIMDISLTIDSLSKPVAPSPICGCAISHDGSTMAFVTPDAEQCVISTDTLKRIKFVKGAHLTFATAVGYTEEDDAIVSVSADASATLTELKPENTALLLKLLIFAFIIAVLAAAIHLIGRESAKKEPEKTLNWVSALHNLLNSPM